MRNARPARVVPVPDAVVAIRALAAELFADAAATDEAAAFPAREVARLAEAGLLMAPFPVAIGGAGLGVDPATADAARAVLTTIGRASLTLGRLYEGHLNAVKLATIYGGDAALGILAAEAAAGRLSGVWNAERGDGPHAHRVEGGWRVAGRKVHCSGAGTIRRPLVTAAIDAGKGPLMMLPEVDGPGASIDLTIWRASGMRGTATGTLVLDDLFVADAAVVGSPGDYYRSPLFSGGAWRVLAVQLGGLARVVCLHARHLGEGGRTPDAIGRARFGEGAAAYEAARLLVREAAARAEDPAGDAAAIDAYVDLARGGFERLALIVIEAARRGVGLSGFIAPHPLDRTIRDLETYLRQPFLDASRDAAASHLLARGGTFA